MNNAVLAPPSRFGIQPFTDVVGKRGRYTGHGEDFVSRFYRLVRRWRAETAYVSSATDMFEHPAFVEIVGMGRKLIRLIIDELRQQPDHLVGALVRITGQNPVLMHDRGDVYAMATAWIEWYQRQR
jgi:hypothetical protein